LPWASFSLRGLSERAGGHATIIADAAALVMLLAAAAAAAWFLSGIHDHIPLLSDRRSDDVWFQADSRPVFTSMTNRFAVNKRMDIHPLFRLIALPPTYMLKTIFGLSGVQSVRVVLAAAAGAWLGLFYALLRVMGCRRPDSLVFALVAATSAPDFFGPPFPRPTCSDR
jgi:hypothetical protein